MTIRQTRCQRNSSEIPYGTHGRAQKLDHNIMIYDFKVLVESWNPVILHYECKWTLSPQSFPYYRGGKKVRVTKLRGQLESKAKDMCFLSVIRLTIVRRCKEIQIFKDLQIQRSKICHFFAISFIWWQFKAKLVTIGQIKPFLLLLLTFEIL